MTDEKLIGDLTAETLRKLRADRVARAYTRITGKPCNCGQRKEKLNELHRKWRAMQARKGIAVPAEAQAAPDRMIGAPTIEEI